MIDRSRPFRVLLAVWTLAYLLPRWPHAAELYLRPVLRQDPPLLAWALPPSAAVVHLCFCVATVCLVALVVGVRVRLAHAGLLGAFTAIACFDTLMPRGYGTLALVQWGLLWFAPHEETDRRPLGWGTRLVMLQLSSVYLWSVPAKLLGGSGWWTGKVLVLTLNGDEFGNFLLSSFHVTPAAGFVLSWATLFSELFVGLGLWFERTWKPAAVVLVAMHLAMGLSLKVSPLFQFLMLAHLVLFVRVGAGEASGGEG